MKTASEEKEVPVFYDYTIQKKTDYNGFGGVANSYDYKRSRSHASRGNESLPQIRYNQEL